MYLFVCYCESIIYIMLSLYYIMKLSNIKKKESIMDFAGTIEDSEALKVLKEIKRDRKIGSRRF